MGMAAFVLAGCSDSKETSSKSAEDKEAATKEEAQVTIKEKKVELPNVIDEIIGWEWEAFKKNWGEPSKEVQVDSGVGYQFAKIPNITIVPDANNYISSVIINNKNADIFGTKVGQTPAEIKQIMEKEAILLMSEGEDEMDGGWFIQGQVDYNKVAWYSSDAEDKPVKSILLTVTPTENSEASTREQTAQPIHVTAQITDIYENLIGQTVVAVQITNLEPRTITTGTVKIKINGTYGSNPVVTGVTETAEFNNVAPGETRNYEFSNIYEVIDGIEIIDASGN
ncbi:hypothetical protein [Bacillus massilinigeriensis]|uniref:hypothetical protein n=1 Tax=Bacillus massilionigeriensis TaxID=1805475 RepID=UPI00096B5C28|nr:hypothetical protein [Bacillus massilionigeriensis]